jgi:filamentous hemagglutinin family protein
MHAPTPFKKNALTLAIHACCYSMLSAVSVAHAAPVGGEVVGGSGGITQSGLSTTINQASQNLAVNWQSFNVNSNERVQFIQPNASSIALNRILSNNGSVIAGRIDANGQVILANPNGVFFTPTATLNVGGIIASGLDINPTDFMNGQYLFHEIPGTHGAVINSGMINASLGGNVALLGKQVENNGLISATLGSVTLAAGKQAVLTFDNGGLLGVRVSEAMLQKDIGVDPAIVNSGTIQAQGGRVLLTASVSQEVFSKAVNTSGVEPATSVVVNADGSFTLGSGADVVNSGSIDTSTTTADQNIGRIVLLGENVTSSGSLHADTASGNGGEIELHARDTTLLTLNSVSSARAETNGQGGIVKVLGDKVGMFDHSSVDVSGAHGGGQALIGGDYQGKNSRIRNARITVVDRAATLSADALQNGDGGKVIVWADGNTSFLGSIFARGGTDAGNGGMAETSGKVNLLFDGQVDLTAPQGQTGSLLLDPRDIEIKNSGGTNLGSPNIVFSDTPTTDMVVTATSITSVLQTTNISLQANRDILVTDAILAPTNTVTANTLTMQAGDDIRVNNSISLGINNLTLIAGTSGCGTSCQTNNAGHDITQDKDASLYTSGNVLFAAADSVIINGVIGGTSAATQPTSLTVRAGNNITLDATGSNNGAITTNGAVSLTAADALLQTDALTPTVAPTGTLTGIITVSGNVTSNGNNFTATTTSGYFDNFVAGSGIINTGAGNVSITANGSDGGIASGIPTGAFLGKITAGSLDVTTTTGQIVQTTATTGGGNTALNLDVANAASFNAGNNPIDLQNAANSLRGTIALTTTGTTHNATLWNSATTTTLGATNIAGILTVNAARNLGITNAPVTSAGDMALTFGSLGTGSYSFCYLSGGVCANSSTFTGPTLTSSGGNLNIIGAAGTNTFNLAGLTLSAPGVSKSVTLTGAAGTDTVIGQNIQTAWDLTATNSGTLANAQGTVSFTGMENLTGGSGDDTFTVNPSALTPAVTLVNLDTGGGANTVTVNANGTVSGTVTTGSGTNTITVNGTVGSISGTAGNGANTINVNTGGNVSGTITTGSGVDIYNIAGTVGGLIDGGAGSDTLAVLTPGRTVKLGAAILNNGYLNVDRVETISATGSGNTLLGHDNSAVLTSWNITAPNQGTVVYTSTNATTVAFSAFDRLTGGTGADTFTLGATGTITGEIDGGTGTGNTLVARQGVANTWSFEATLGSGSLTQAAQPSPYVAHFSNIQTYTGSGTGLDWADYSGIAGAIPINAGSFTGFAGIIGNGQSILNGENGQTNNWSVQAVFDQNSAITDGLNDGVVNSNTPREVRFVNFGTLTGGDGIDNFVMDASGSFSGQINGGGGVNTLRAKDVANTWSISTTNSTLIYGGITTTFNNIQNLTGGSTSDDNFTLNSGASITGIDAGNGNNTVTINAGGIVTGTITAGTGVDTITVAGTVGSVDAGDGATNSVRVTSVGSVVGAISSGTGADAITVNGVAGSVNAGAGNDSIILGATGNVTGVIDGGADADTLDAAAKTAPTVQLSNTQTTNLDVYQVETLNATGATLVGNNLANTWVINNPSSGQVAGVTFNGFQNLIGGDGVDTFTVNSSIASINTGNGATNSVTVNAFGQVTGAITGGTGADTIDVSGTVGSIDTGAGSDNITLRVGSLGNSDISGGDGADTFDIGGTVTGNLYGNAGDDIFTIVQGTVSGTVYGGTQTISLGDRLNVGPNRSITIGDSLAQSSIRIQEIEGVISTGGTLSARDGYNTTWNITGSDVGTIEERSGTTLTTSLSFTGFKNLNGSTGNDIFNITGDGSLTGEINAGNGVNSLNVTMSPTRQPGQVYYIGGTGSDTVTINGTASTVAYNPAFITLNGNTYDRLTYTNAVPSNFFVNYTSASVESVFDQVTANTLAINGTNGSDTVSLGNGTFSVNSSRLVTYTNKSNLIVDGGLGALNWIDLTDNIAIANSITLKNAATLTQMASRTLTAADLVLDSINVLPNPLNTTIAGLSVTNSGPVSINETDALQLNQINTTGSLNVVATGNITDSNTAQRNISGALTLSTTGNILLNTPNQNYLSGPIALTGATVNINNSVATNLASVNATTLTVTSAGNITQTGAITVPGYTTLSAANGSIILDNANNNFNDLYVNAASAVSLTDIDRINTGSISANSISLHTATGIGSGDILSATPTVLNTTTSNLTVKNGSGSVLIANSGPVSASIITQGDILFTNNADVRVRQLNTNGGSQVPATNLGGNILLSVIGSAYGNPDPMINYNFTPDIVAQNFTGLLLSGNPRDVGQYGRPMSVLVNNEFTLYADHAYIHYLGINKPSNININAILLEYVNFNGLNEQLIDVESLGEFDPAIFTAVRNYYYEDVAIKMPDDQRLDGPDEDEDEKDKKNEEKL